MFSVHCPQHGARVLIFTSGIERLRNTSGGIEVDYHCTCGHRGTWRTGRKAEAASRATGAGAEYRLLRPLAATATGTATGTAARP